MAQEKRIGAVTNAERKARKIISDYDRKHSDATKHGKTLETPNAVKQARAKISAIDREKTRIPGTPQHENRQRQLHDARMEEAIFNSAHDPITFDSDDW